MRMINNYTMTVPEAKLNRDDLSFLNMSGRQAFYKQGYTGQNVIGAVLDTGISLHSEFFGRLHPQESFIYYDSDCDDNGHGTHVAATIGGKNTGIAPDVQLKSFKVLDWDGGGNTWDIIKALDRAREWTDSKGNRIDFINMSLGAPGEYYKSRPAELEAYEKAINACVDSGIAVIVAAGNAGREVVEYPACFQSVISVAAVDQDKKVAMFSTRSNEVDVCQVGVDVLSAWFDGGYVKFNGTSMAAPIVSGIAALLISKWKAMHNGERMPENLLWETLKYNTVDIGVPGIDKETGAGFCTLQPLTGSLKMEFQKGNHNIRVNGVNKFSDAAPVMVKVPGGGRLELPIGFIADEFGCYKKWIGETQTGVIEV